MVAGSCEYGQRSNPHSHPGYTAKAQLVTKGHQLHDGFSVARFGLFFIGIRVDAHIISGIPTRTSLVKPDTSHHRTNSTIQIQYSRPTISSIQCQLDDPHNIPLLASINWILVAVWEVLALCLAVWIAVKHFRELRQHSAGGIIEDCFTVLMKAHMVHFASFVAVSCFHLVLDFPPKLFIVNFLDANIISGLLQILEVVQMSVPEPRLIFGVWEYHAKLVADSDAATGMTSIVFQERVHISTGSGV
ncbi:hypothetical protein BDR06DRAFT_977587 [Suillus hirtellus]|nr:hypothetical protein BDR06DRAFT_977587 [Suillus hirtellus]